MSFCDAAPTLDVAVGGGEGAYRAMDEFWNQVTEETVASELDEAEQ